MTIFEGELRARADELIARYPEPRSALLPLLYLVQSVEGHVTPGGMREAADLLGLSTAEVQAVATFYTMYKREPTAPWLVSVCTNVSCALVGAREVFQRARAEAGDGVEVEEVECLGACDAAPVVQVNYCNYDRLGPDDVAELIGALRADAVPEPSRGPKPVPHDATARILAGLGDERG